MKIDINCDMGESFGAWKLGLDEEVMPLISSANVACGFHASDPLTMMRTVGLAARHGVAVGAHPGYHDLVGFGRRQILCTPEEIMADVIYQIGALTAFCGAAGVQLEHVKAHGALYNLAARDPKTAAAVAMAIKAVNPSLRMVCLAGSAMVQAAKDAGLALVEEAFADRAYLGDGALVPRERPGALIKDPSEIARRVLLMAREKRVLTIDGASVPLDAGTICVHGDTPGAVSLLKAVRAVLEGEGIGVVAPGIPG